MIQSNLFLCISLCASVFGYAIDFNSSIYFFIISMALVVVFGVPHGALDVLFARQTYGLANFKSWLKFLTTYTAVSAAIIFVWLLIPNGFFIAFLILSVIHFSADLNISGFNRLKLTYGLSIIVMPSLRYSAELTSLYGMMIDIEVAQNLVRACQFFIYPVALLLVLQLLSKTISPRTKLEILSVVLLMTALHPIFAFTLYFCFMHSARHLIRSHFFLAQCSKETFLKALLLPTIAVIFAGTIIWFFTFTQSLEADLIRIIFIGLAALTVPHAWVLKKSNFLSE